MSIKKQKALKFLKEANYKANLFSKDPKRKVGAIILEKDTFIQNMGKREDETQERYKTTNRT